MNIQSKTPRTAAEFLLWNEGREDRWDFVEGRLVDMMVRVSRSHAIVAGNLLALFKMALPMPPFVVTSADFGVTTANSVRYPDLVIDGEIGSGSDLAAKAPILIAEVLSPSTMATDFGRKVEEYKTIGSLRHYIVAAQDDARVWVWTIDPEGIWSGPEMTSGKSESIDLIGLQVSLALADIYAGIDIPA